MYPHPQFLPRAHAQGVKQSVCTSVVVVVVVVGTKIARSRVLGVCAYYKHDQSVDIVEKVVSMRFSCPICPCTVPLNMEIMCKDFSLV